MDLPTKLRQNKAALLNFNDRNQTKETQRKMNKSNCKK